MLSTSGNPLNTNNTTNASNVNSNAANQSTKSNILSTSSLMNSEFMLPTLNNLTNNNNNPMAATSSYLNDYNKLYRDVGLFQPPPQQQSAVNALNQQKQQNATNLIGNNNLNNLVVNNITNSLNNLGNHSNNLPTHNNLNGLQNHNLNQSNLSSGAATKQQLINNPDFIFYLNRCNQFLELNMYQNALEEINQALNLVTNSAVARYRKAQALLGLKRFQECEKELWMCINLEPNVVEYRKELIKVKQIALMSLNLNLDQNQILMAAQKYETIKDAMDALMWSNNMLDFNNYSNPGALTTNNLNETNLMNGWSLHAAANLTTNNSTTANNRFGSINQLINNGNNLLFNSSLISNVNSNLLLNNNVTATANLINRTNNANAAQQQNNLTGNNVVNTTSAAAVVNNLKNQQQTPNSQSNNHLNQLNSNNSKTNNSNSNSSSTTATTNNQQQTSNSSLNSDQQTNNQQNNLITNGLNNLSNGNRFNYLLRGLDQQHLLQQQQQSTNGQNINNQNLINNQQQQLYNRILPSFIENNNTTNSSVSTIDKTNQAVVLNCNRNLNSKLNLNENPTSTNSILNGTNGLLMMNNNLNNSAPSPICAKLTNNTSNSGSNSASLTNSCNYNIFNQMPEMKLIETIVPNLLSSLNNNTSSTNHQNNTNNANDLTSTNSTSGNDLTASVITNNHKLLATLAKEVNNNVKDSLVNNLVDNFTNNLQVSQQTNVTKQLETTFDDCKSANNKKTGKSIDLITEFTSADKTINKLDSGIVGFDLKSSNNSVNDDLINNLTNNQQNKSIVDDNQHSLVTSCSSSPSNQSNNNATTNLTQSNVTSSAGANSATSAMQCTSYSDIVKRAKKITQQSTISNGNSCLAAKQSDATNLTNKIDNDSSIEDCSSSNLASKRPTNLWAYNGLRVANVSLTVSKQTLMSLFSKFGRVRLLERIVNKTTTNNIWVYYDNPVSPVDAVTKLQNAYIEGICVDIESPLRLFFAPTDDQKDLKFSRPKQPPDNKGECYYWRTTNCFSKDQCPLLHIQANKNIDSQVWMRLNPEKEDQENTSTSNNSTANESASES